MILNGESADVIASLKDAYAQSGISGYFRKRIEVFKERSNQVHGLLVFIAIDYAQLGEKEAAFEYLEKAYEAREPGLSYLKIEPMLDPIRSDPRYENLLRRTGLAE